MNPGSPKDSDTPSQSLGSWRGNLIAFACWLVVTLVAVGLFVFTANTDVSKSSSPLLTQTKGMLLPGETSHGHYQIELACSACHTPNMGVKQDACLNCHEQELEIARDTHPATKFSDPTNAERLELLDATKCITCHREHVPNRTHPMGLSLPTDYCYHCHKDVAEDRPSHAGMAFNSCATAGCHNYHDNRALYENFLSKHAEEPANLDSMLLPELSSVAPSNGEVLSVSDQDAPPEHQLEEGHQHLTDWADTVHALKGVNCTDCHVAEGETRWNDVVPPQNCKKCHESQVEQYFAGRHGMRYSVELAAMTPGEARLPMKKDRHHESLNCSSCHGGHRFDTKHAAVDACVSCHNDWHSNAFAESEHFQIWKQELSGEAEKGSGVSCASCHMPRYKNENGKVVVQHNQNNNLRPNEKMIRSVCMNCHGVEFSISSLANADVVKDCFAFGPESKTKSVQMAKDWFAEKERLRQERKRKRAAESK